MKSLFRRGDRTIFCLFCGAQLLLPLVSIVLFQRRFGYGRASVGVHLLNVGLGYGWLFAFAFLLCALRGVWKRPFARYLLPLAWGTLTVALYFTHLLAWGGQLTNGMNIRVSWALPYVRHPSAILDVFPISPLVFWAVLAGVPLAILAVYMAAARRLASAQIRLLVWLRRKLRAPRVLWSVAGGAALAAAAAVAAMDAATAHAPYHSTPSHLFGDPIFASFFEENTPLHIVGVGGVTVAYTAPARFHRRNVILIVMDACRADHLGVLGYGRDTTPFLNSLRDAGGLHAARSFYAASCCTFGGVLTLLRSQNSFKMTVQSFGLQDVLKRAGYRVHFVLGGDLSNFHGLSQFYGHNLDSFSDGLDSRRHYNLNDDRGVLETLDQLPACAGAPTFLYLHLMSTHTLGMHLPDYDVYQPSVGPRNKEVGRNHYDNGIVQADASIRTLFDRLAAKGYLQDSLVVITGDHGESLGERGLYGHSFNLYAEEVEPPLLIYDPEPAAYPGLDFARQVDVAPTILDRLGLPIPSTWDGRSLLRPGPPPRFSYLSMGDMYAVLDHTPERTLKYVYYARTGKEELYDDTHDPAEQRDILATAGAQELGELRAAAGVFSVHPGS